MFGSSHLLQRSLRPTLEALERRLFLTSNLETWDFGANGWSGLSTTELHASGGVNDSGFIEAYYASGVVYSPPAVRGLATANPSGGVFNGNVGARYEGGLPDGAMTISFYVKNLTTDDPDNTRNVVIQFFNNSTSFEAAEGNTTWYMTLPFTITTADWTHVTTTINTNWTDAEAQANGWSKLLWGPSQTFTRGSGASWASVCQSVGSLRLKPSGPLTSDCTTADGDPVGQSRLGVDELTFSTMPALTNVENWTDTGAQANGWIGIYQGQWVPTGGVDNDGYFEAYHTDYVSAGGIKGLITSSGGVFNGNVDSRYAGGTPDGELSVSFYYKNCSSNPLDTSSLQIIFFNNASEYGNGTTNWTKVFKGDDPIVSTQWSLLTTRLNTNWTDAEARAYGWIGKKYLGGNNWDYDNIASWTSVMQNVGSIRVLPDGALATSGNGRFGIDKFTFSRGVQPLKGDFDGNSVADAHDIDLLLHDLAAGSPTNTYDVSGDGRFSSNDADYWVRVIHQTEYGDANLDRKVDSADQAILNAHLGEAGQGWAGGDFNGDGVVNSADQAILNAHLGYDSQPANVTLSPENTIIRVKAGSVNSASVADAALIKTYLRRIYGVSDGFQVDTSDSIDSTGKQVIMLAIDPSLEHLETSIAGMPGLYLISSDGTEGLDYATTHFLDQYLGVRFYMPGDLWTGVAAGPMTLSQMDVHQFPFVKSSFATGFGTGPAGESTWLARNALLHRLGGSHQHTMYARFDPAFYNDPINHPDTYWPEIYPILNGQRYIPSSGTDQYWQPNFSAAHLVDAAIDSMTGYFAEHPDDDYIAFSVQDSFKYSEDPDSLATIEAFGGDKRAAYSSMYWSFMSNLGMRAAAQFPGKKILGIAYGYVTEPPTSSLPDNVIPFTNLHLAEFEAENVTQRADSWLNIADNYGNHDWMHGLGYLIPRTYSGYLSDYYRHIQDSGINDMYGHVEMYPNWGMNGPAYWIASRIMWDPVIGRPNTARDGRFKYRQRSVKGMSPYVCPLVG